MRDMKKRVSGLALLCCCMVLSLGAACPGNQYQKAAKLSSDFASGVATFQTVEIQAHESGLIADQENKDIQTILLQVADAGHELDAAINKTHNTAGALSALNAAASSLDKLNADGVLHVKNPQAQVALKSALLTLHVTIDSMIAFAN
jgi:hypothetical protein